jgi:Toprim domain-containing protein
MVFTEILQRNRVPHFTEGKYCRPGWVQFFCPFCSGGSDPNKPYAGYNIAFHYVHCWRCGPHNLTKTVSLLANIPWREAIDLVKDISSDKRQSPPEHHGRLILPKWLGPLQDAHKRYLKNRGFVPADLERLWQIQGIGISSQLAWRIFIPIYYHGEVVSWTTRGITDKEPRYISAGLKEESAPHKSLIYGSDYCTHTAIVVEGPVDVWKIGPGAVATLGTSVTPAQILRISKYPRRIIAFDNETAAQKRARALCRALSVLPGETANLRLDTKDAGGANEDELTKIRKLLQ